MSLNNLDTTYSCDRCGMKFYSSYEIANHRNKFCINSGLNSINGLVKYERQSALSSKLGKYGENIINDQKRQDSNHNALEMGKQGQNFRSIQPMKRSYTYNFNKLNSMSNRIDQQRKVYLKKEESSQKKKELPYGYNILNNSQMAIRRLKNLKRQANKQLRTKITKENSKQISNNENQYSKQVINLPSKLVNNIPIIEKPKNNLQQSQRKKYAYQKLIQLDNICNMYDKSGGKDMSFKQNIQKTRKFYKKMINEQENRKNRDLFKSKSQSMNKSVNPQNDQKHGELTIKQQSANLSDKQLTKKLSIKQASQIGKTQNNQQNLPPVQKKLLNQQSNNVAQQQPYFYPTFYPPHQSSPQIIVVPSPYLQKQPTPSSSAKQEDTSKKMKQFHQMIEQQNEQHNELMKLLKNMKKKQKTPQVDQKPQQKYQFNISKPSSTKQKEANYYFQKPGNKKLFSEQKLLMALKRQQIDELRLLSNLPQQLQQLKKQSVIKLIKQQTQIQKQILKYKLLRSKQQQKNKIAKQSKKIENYLWLNQCRKNNIQWKINNILESSHQKQQKKQYFKYLNQQLNKKF